jgi:hypothetical protein
MSKPKPVFGPNLYFTYKIYYYKTPEICFQQLSALLYIPKKCQIEASLALS